MFHVTPFTPRNGGLQNVFAGKCKQKVSDYPPHELNSVKESEKNRFVRF